MAKTFRSSRVLLWANAVTYLAFGATFLASPAAIAEQLGIALTSPTALADFRAIYGGLPLGVGMVMLAGIFRASFRTAAVALTGLCALELGCARLLSWVISGAPSGLVLGFMGVELLTFVWALAVYRSLDGRTETAATSALHAASA